MTSSRMRTARELTVFPGTLPPGGGSALMQTPSPLLCYESKTDSNCSLKRVRLFRRFTETYQFSGMLAKCLALIEPFASLHWR